MKLKTTLNLEKEFTFYASYHSQPVNVAIHLVCIWTILATALLLLQFSPSLVASPSCFNLLPFGDHANVNLSLVFSLVYVVCYIIMEPFAGTLGAGLVGAIYLYSGYLVNTGTLVLGYSIWKVALAIHVTAWILQFIGHGVFEGRAPALLDSLDQALLMAPLFVLLEVLFSMGYRREFHEKIMKQVEVNMKEFQDKKKCQKVINELKAYFAKNK